MAVAKRMQRDEPRAEPSKAKPFAKPFRFGFLIHDVSRMRRTLFDQEMKSLGITRSQWWVLATLSRHGNAGMQQVDLARLLEVGKGTIGGLVDRLQVSGHIERHEDPNDRRSWRVFITDRGYQTIKKMETVGSKLNDSIFAGVPAPDRKVTEDTLAKVRENIRHSIKNGCDFESKPHSQGRKTKRKA